ncbi:MAG: DNA repair protein RadA [Deltaproteobacteria bacterium]|nr:DNA repair protein RadA [Deltaproteobacteria bacterium]
MSKVKEYNCRSCGAKYPKWTGKCAHCGEWESLVETIYNSKSARGEQLPVAEVLSLEHIDDTDSRSRWITEVDEFDRVIGGGLVRGSFGLLGGSPGIGKSTLILQLLGRFAKMGKKVLYITGEESPLQIKQRAERLSVSQRQILILAETNLESIIDKLKETRADFVVIDSIQTLYTDENPASPGSLSQVRETASLLMRYTKKSAITCLLVGHVTKDGDIAGPKTLEHMVDYVLYLEGAKKENSRILRSVKNRFGDISEIGLFKMTEKGLVEIKKPSWLFLDHAHSPHPGSAVFAAKEGTRTLFFEIQVLVGDTQQSYPSRTTMGIEKNRVQVLIAVLEKHLSYDFSRNDIYVNLAGGFKVLEPAIDLAAAAALLSSHANVALPEKSVFIGELALNGEVRSVPSLLERLKESQRCGFKQAFIPANSAIKDSRLLDSMNLSRIKTVRDLKEQIL